MIKAIFLLLIYLKFSRFMFLQLLCVILILLSSVVRAEKPEVILHASFDITRELFKEMNAEFIKQYGPGLKIRQSHGGSGKQTASIIHGLPADIASLALSYHMDLLAEKNLVASNWRELFPNQSSPFTTSIVFLVPINNPKQIKDWPDLVRPGIKVITANPKTSGGALWNYVAAWIYANKTFPDDKVKIQDYMRKLYHNAPVLDSTARAAAVTFLKRHIGDVLITWANEAEYIITNLDSNYEIIVPSVTVKIDIPVAVVTRKNNQDKQAIAKKYIEFLFSEQGQKIAAKYYYQGYKTIRLKNANIVNVEDYIDWKDLKQQHFGENGIFEQIYR